MYRFYSQFSQLFHDIFHLKLLAFAVILNDILLLYHNVRTRMMIGRELRRL
jgi:hypothetical protein